MKMDSIKAKLTVICAIALVAIIFSVGFSYYIAAREVKGIMEADLNSVADSLDKSLTYIASVKPDALKDEVFRKQMNSIKIGKSGYVYFLDERGIMLTHPSSEGKDQTGVYHNDFIRKHKEGGIIEYMAITTGQDKIAAFRYIAPWKGWIIPGVNKADYFEVLRNSFLKWNLTFAVITIILLLTVSAWTLRGILKPMKEVISVADRMAEGDLSFDIKVGGRGEMDQMLAAMKHMLIGVRGIVVSVKNTSSNIATASSQLLNTAGEISRGMEGQAARSNQIATAAEELSQTVIDVAKNTSNIAGISSETYGQAQNGATVVNQSVVEVQAIATTVAGSSEVMQRLGQSSNEIGDIVNVINDIADQTNLLALNAAIEAARAGEQGRGFAVVADEVRKLAERTSHATSQINAMIRSIQGEVGNAVASMDSANARVETGVEFSKKAGVSLGHIVESVNSLQSMVQQIASATEEMSSVSETISADIQNIAEGSREISTGGMQISNASADLSRMANELQGLVSRFKV